MCKLSRSPVVLAVACYVSMAVGLAHVAQRAAADTTRADCRVGNLASAVPPPATGIFAGGEEYAYLIYPPDQCQCAEGGFTFESIGMLLEFAPHQVPVTFAAVAVWREAVWDDGLGCYLPGGELFASAPVIFPIALPGIYDIVIPTPGWDFLPFAQHYFIGLRYVDVFAADLPVDDQPQACVAYRGDGTSWQDLDGLKRAAGGKVIVWGDIVCGSPVIPSDATTWGTLKAVYR